MRSLWTRRRLLLASAVAVGGIMPAFKAQAQVVSGPSVNFNATSSAYGFDSTISNPSIPLGLVVEGAGPTAQANLTSTQQSNGFASFPYPGDTVVGLPGLLSAVFLGGAPVPAYPLYTSTGYGDPPSSANYPGIALQSTSELDETRATAVVGTSAMGYTAEAEVRANSDSTVTSTATATLKGIDLGPALSVSGVKSTATEVLNSDGSQTGTASLSISDITVPGASFTIPTTTPTSAALPIPIPGIPQLPRLNFPPVPIPFGGTRVTSPKIGFDNGQFTITLPVGGSQAFAIPAQSVLSFFQAAGINITYQAAQRTATSIVAPVLTFQTTFPAPPQNQYFNGPTPIEIALGRTNASINGAVVPVDSSSTGASSSQDSSGAGGAVGPPSSGADGAVGGAPTAVPAVSDTGSGTAITTGSVGPSPSLSGMLATGATGGAGPSVSGGQPVATGPLQNVSRTSRISNIYDIYFVFVAVALIGTGAATFLRYVGVRQLWTS